MSLPTSSELQKTIDTEKEAIDRLEKARDRFVVQWNELEQEQEHTIALVRQYLDKIKMRDVLENIHSIRE